MPEQNPIHQPIPNGPATKGGVAATGLLAVVALVSAVLHGDHSSQTITALILAVLPLLTIMAGKYAQATALIKAHGGPGTPPVGVSAPMDGEAADLSDPDLDSPKGSVKSKFDKPSKRDHPS